jgi:hypothetical protein
MLKELVAAYFEELPLNLPKGGTEQYYKNMRIVDSQPGCERGTSRFILVTLSVLYASSPL